LHQAVKNNLKINITIAKEISKCLNSWDNFLPMQHHLKSRHLLAFENARIDDVENNYLQVFLKDKLIGLVYLQQFTFKHKHLNFKQQQTLKSKFIQFVLPAQLPLLICGHLFRIDFQGFYFSDKAHEILVFDAIELFIQHNKGNKPCGIIIKDCAAPFVEQKVLFFKYHFFNGDVTMELNRRPHWLSFDDYLKDLNKNYLQRGKKIIKSFAEIERKELSAAEIIEQTMAIEKLYWNVVHKQTIKLGVVNAKYFYELKKDLQQNFEFHALYKNDIMVGFYTFIFYAAAMETHYIGIDYEANKTYKIYFNILFLSTQKMIERQLNKLELGRTAREAKVNLGALPKQIFNYVKIKNPIVKITVYYFLKKFNKAASHNVVERSPLK
jgi:hypothetical protein